MLDVFRLAMQINIVLTIARANLSGFGDFIYSQLYVSKNVLSSLFAKH